MAQQIQLRRDTAADWTSTNPTLAVGEVGYETDTYKFKIGNGTTEWASRSYFSDLDAIHDNITGEISAVTEKAVPVNGDWVLIEDSAAGNAKKKAQLGNLPSGGGGDNISVNSVAATDADFDDATPAAPAGDLNVKWQKDALTPNNISAYVDVSVLEPLVSHDNLADFLANEHLDWTADLGATNLHPNNLSLTEAELETAVSDDNPVFDGDFSTNGLCARTAAGTYANRTITGTASEVEVTDGDGVSGNPTIGLPSAVAITTSLTVGGNRVEPEASKSITVEDPTNAEDISIFFTNKAITITEMRAVLVGSATPSVTWTIRHGTDRSAVGAEVVTGGTVTTSTTTGSDVTAFNDATIVADSFVWLETTAQSGTVDELHITLFFTYD